MHSVFTSLLLFVFASATPEEPSLTFEALYKYGKAEYTDENWYDCVGFMKRALEDFNYYKDLNLWCRERCDISIGTSEEYPELSMMFTNAQKALCLLRCRQDKFTVERPALRNNLVYQEFLNRRPYHYMQLCYWKLRDMENAVKHAYTYLISNPTDEDSLANIRFYMKQKSFKENMLVDLLRKPFEESYIRGVEDYMAGRWKSCTTEFKKGLDHFFRELNICRHLCEDVLDWSSLEGDNPEISVVMTSAYASVLRCKNGCVKKLSIINGRYVKNFLASFFEYMHICEFKLNHGAFASQAVANALLLDPENIVMRRNKLFYSDKYQRIDLFEPSEDIVRFYKRETLEKRFIDFIDERFRFFNGELTPEVAADRERMNMNVLMGDDFDYSQIQLPLLNSNECSTLFVAAKINKSVGFSQLLIDELHQRIGQRYGRLPNLQGIFCALEGQRLQSECERGALIVSIDEQRCGAVLSEDFDGCAVVFCV
ncbi:hypothetical protein M3Y98_00431100 [Aphelenchoides besseyi]|nr:hypothetical protein M3Y98_00431100 [Aphelenchoides besseyi]KAI6202301.1 hypothetical protein M3Y96_00933600 [Aphelenchoides besseyi]